MGDSVEVTTSSLREAGQGLEEAAERLDRLWGEFTAQVQAMGDIFGDDMVGGLIAASYQAAHEIASSHYGSVVESLRGFHEGLSVVAEGYDRVEQQCREAFEGLLRELAG